MVDTLGSSRLDLAHIEEAASVIDPVFLNTPQTNFETLSRVLGTEIILKVETLNPIRSFKGRGADYYVHRLPDTTPLVLASAGNFGQGLAYAARKRHVPVTIFAATNANELKVARMRDFGANVLLQGEDFDAAKTDARDYAARMGYRFVEDGREVPISEGAGTIALELLRCARQFEAILVPIGNGAMITGMGTWIKAHAPHTRVIGVCASGAPAMEHSWRTGHLQTTSQVQTIADGIAVRIPIPEALKDISTIVDDILLVDDDSVLRAMRLLLEHTGLLIEPSGAVGIASIIANRKRFAGQCLATVLCGGNVTPAQIQEWFIAPR